jgi:pimeloyl-ACP methyl ester carboxylesterase
MSQQTVILLHGFASSGNSTKAQYLRGRFAAVPDVQFHAIDFNPTPRDFEYMTITGMINRLRQYVLDHDLRRVFIVGSSIGALVGLNYAHRFGEVSRMLLLAPALSYLRFEPVDKVFHYAFNRELSLRDDFYVDGAMYAEPVPPPVPVTIIHGCHDDVIPIARSRRYAALYPEEVELTEVDSDHQVNDQLDFIWERLAATLS